MDPVRAAVAVVLAALLLTGPLGVDVTADRSLGDGTATVEADPPETLRITDGRFGADIAYLRVPETAVDVRAVEGSPRLVYEVGVPELGVEERAYRVVDRPGTVRMRVPHREVDAAGDGPYRGYVAVRVQSFDSYETVSNRSVEVTVE